MPAAAGSVQKQDPLLKTQLSATELTILAFRIHSSTALKQTEAQYLMTMSIPPCFPLNITPTSNLDKPSQLDSIHLHPLINPLGSISQFLQLRYKIIS